jgi:hypothetical protein
MASKTISNLPESFTVEDKQVFPVEDNISTKKMTIGTFRDSLMRQMFYGINFCNDTGKEDDEIVITPSIPITELKNGLRLFIMCNHSNTSDVKMKIHGISNSVSVVSILGQQLTPKAIAAGSMREFVYFDGEFYLMADISLAKDDLSNVTLSDKFKNLLKESFAKKSLENVPKLSQVQINNIMPGTMDYSIYNTNWNDNSKICIRTKNGITIQAGRWRVDDAASVRVSLHAPMGTSSYMAFVSATDLNETVNFSSTIAFPRQTGTSFPLATTELSTDSFVVMPSPIDKRHTKFTSRGCWLVIGF